MRLAGPFAANGAWIDGVARVAAPLFLAIALILGGASQNNLVEASVIELLAIAILVWLVLDPDLEPAPAAARPILIFAGALGLLLALQLVPLPPSIWTLLPGRGEIARGFDVLGMELPWLPLSLTPSWTLHAALQFLPPAAMLGLLLKLRWRHAARPMAWVIPLLGLGSMLLGVLQVIGGESSPLYWHDPTNKGSPVGVFANANHQADFLVLCLPFVGALVGELRTRTGLEASAEKVGLTLALAALLVAGVLAAGSLAGYILLAPALTSGVLIALRSPATKRTKSNDSERMRTALLAGLAIVGVSAAMIASPYVATALGSVDESGPMSRPDLYAHTLKALGAFGVAGAGFGSFKTVYPWFEDKALQSPTWAPHAHNDLLEILFEAGLPGALLLGAGLWWFATAAWRVWTEERRDETRLKKAASAALLLVLVHSLVDYPLRTSAIATVAALCAGLLVAERRVRTPQPVAELAAPRRHVVL